MVLLGLKVGADDSDVMSLIREESNFQIIRKLCDRDA